MKNPGHCCLAALLIGGLLTPAWAAAHGEEPASLTVQIPGLEWSRSTAANDSKTTSLLTSDLVDSMIWVSIGQVNLYFYPFQDSSESVSLSTMLRDDLEVGIDLGWNSRSSDVPKSERSSELLGGFFTWAVPLGAYSIENIGLLDFTRTKTTDVDSTSQEETTRKLTGHIIKGSSSILVPLAKNAWYMAGVWVAAMHDKDHSSGSTEKSQQFGVTLAGLRVTLD